MTTWLARSKLFLRLLYLDEKPSKMTVSFEKDAPISEHCGQNRTL